MQQRLQGRYSVIQQRDGADVLALVDHVISSLVVYIVVPLVKVGIIVHFDEFVVKGRFAKCVCCPL